MFFQRRGAYSEFDNCHFGEAEGLDTEFLSPVESAYEVEVGLDASFEHELGPCLQHGVLGFHKVGQAGQGCSCTLKPFRGVCRGGVAP